MYRSALDAAPVAIVLTDPSRPDNPVVYVNEEFSRITGYAPADIIGRNMRLLQGPESETTEVERMRAAVAAAQPVTAELTNYRRTGEAFPMRVDIRPILDASGRLTGFIGSLADLTGQQEALTALAESEERLRAVMAAIPLPMLTVRIDGTIARANDIAHEALAAPPGALPGRRLEEFCAGNSQQSNRLHEELQSTGAAHRIELEAKRLDGVRLWVLASAKTYSVRGETRYVLIFQDLTEQKRKERELQEANEEAERNIRARMRFLAAASHDLRQPLQAMALFASALDNHVASPQGRTIVSSLKTSLRGMEEMFDSLLDMSKLDAGVMKCETHDFMITDIFEQLEMNYRPQAEAAGLDLRVVPSSVAVHTDPRLLARILGNFLSNAIRYTRSGRVLMGVRHRGRIACIEVLDTGPGIPENQRLDIFREFRQGAAPAPVGRDTGIGLGLAIVQRLARLLGHALDVRSREGRGSAFSVEVPKAESDWLPFAEAAQEEEVPEVAGATVVVVDDDRDIQEGLSLLLEEWGCHPVIADTAEEAMAALDTKGRRPDLILADLHLRSQSGLAVIRDIRDHMGGAIPAFLFTGDTETPADIGDASGTIHVLVKPLDPLRLRAVLADTLGR
ncbi:MAG: PAS domain S-box protein [Solirubrobacterales bacterium]